jgi:hypothetical protein
MIFITGLCSFAYGISTLPANPTTSHDSFIYTMSGTSLILCVPLSCLRWYYYELYYPPVRVRDYPKINSIKKPKNGKLRSIMKSSKPASEKEVTKLDATKDDEPYKIHPLIVVREPHFQKVELI